MRYIFIATILFLFTSLHASSIGVIELSTLREKSDVIVLAKVVRVIPDTALDNVTIKISSVLKGTPAHDDITVILQVRGGLKEFDPVIRKGEFGIFFLKTSGEYYRTTHGGSIAIFKKQHFK